MTNFRLVVVGALIGGTIMGFLAGILCYGLSSYALATLPSISLFSPPSWYFNPKDCSEAIDASFTDRANKDMEVLVYAIKTSTYPGAFEARFRGPLQPGQASFRSSFDPHVFFQDYASKHSVQGSDEWKTGYFTTLNPHQYGYDNLIGMNVKPPYTFYGYYWTYTLEAQNKSIAIHGKEMVFCCNFRRKTDVPLEVDVSGHVDDIATISMTYGTDGLIDRSSFQMPPLWSETISDK